jgi:inner membrane protein
MGGGKLSSLTDMLTIGTYLCLGALLHIAEDALCGKVPFITPWQKIGVKLFSVGSVTEYLFAIVLVLVCYIIHIQFVIE